LINRSVFDLVPPTSHQLMQQHRFLVECGEVPPPLEVDMASADGPQRRVQFRSTPVQINDRYGMHMVLRDVTSQRAREQALRADKEEAEHMNRLKSRFLAQMSHEIRTPLTTIIGFAEILNENDLGPWNEFATYIERGSQRLLRTINSVLDLSRLETGALELTPVRTDVRTIVQQTVELFRHRAAQKSVQLQVEVPSDPLHARVDQKALERILDNLVGNAVKFTRDRGRVTIRAHEAGDDLIIEVEDTGVGIAPQFIPYLFDAFKQGNTQAPDDQSGSGLGLAITHQLVEFMGGTIDVDSETGVGSRFTVSIPIVPPKPAAR
jgi:signal transduction histidine kinase